MPLRQLALASLLAAVALAAVAAPPPAAAPSAAAAPVDPALFQDLHWRLVGPFRGGRVLAVSGVPGEPDHFYFGAVNGGVWESIDAGRTWRPIFDRAPVGSIGALAVAPSDPRVLYVGTGEADMRSDIAQGKGVFKSVDGGASWRFVGLGDSQQIGRVQVDPRDPDVVFVAALGHPYGPNAERGLFKSTDGGEHWRKVLGPDADTGAIDVVLEPGNPDVVYAALWQTRRPPWNVYPPSNGPGSGLYKSTDGGERWSRIEGDGFAAAPGRIGLAVAPSEPSRVYALVDADEGGLYRSDDRGGHWTRTSGDPRIWNRGWYFGGVTVEPRDADVVYACNTVLLRSADGGRTFVPIEGDATGDDYHQLWIDPEHPERRILGVDQGAIVSVDGGASWSSWHNQPTAQLYHVSTDDRFPYWVYGPQQDSGAVALPSRTATRDGITLQQFKEITAGGEAHNVVVDPLDPEVIYGGTVDRLDLRSEQTRSVDPTVARPDMWRRVWTLPLAFSPVDPRVLYFARQRVFRTADGGLSWEIVSPDLTREAPGVPANLDPVTAAHDLGTGPRRGVVYALAPSRQEAEGLWAGTDDGKVWRTRDGGRHWRDVTPPALTPWSKVGIVEAGHFDADTAYLAVDRHRLDDRRPYVYRTHDGGASWQLAVAGIAADHFVNAVREDPERRGLLYAATEEGVYVSLDDGDRWQPLQLGLPVTSVRDLVVHGADLVIATHGRGIWILDDMTPLRQLSPEVAAAEAWLYRPATAVRERRAAFTGTPLPKDEPTAPNPPAGARIDYVLAKAPAAPVTLDVHDAAGTLVGHWSSADEVPVPDPARLRMAPQWFEAPSHLEATPGMHRFIWPLRYAPPPALAGRLELPPPRRVGATGRLHRDPDRRRPRAHPHPHRRPRSAGGSRPRRLPGGIRAGAAGRGARGGDRRRRRPRAEEIQGRLSARRAAADGELAAALDDFQVELTALRGIAPAPNPYNAWAFPPQRLESLRWMGGALGDLMEMVDGADAAPSPDARAAYAALEPMTRATLDAWERFVAVDVAAIDATLRAAGAAPVGSDG